MNNLTDEELDGLNQAIWQRYGLDFFHYERTSLQRRIARVMHRFDLESSYDLWRKLLYEPDFIYQFVDEITVGLTELFRNPMLWKYLRDELLPSLSNQEEISIWHAGCSTGEEVYSMAITLTESKITTRYSLLATDINKNAVQKSEEGIFAQHLVNKYRQNYLRFNPQALELRAYFDTLPEGDIQAKHSIKRNIKFVPHSLSHNPPPFPKTFDLVFCRNVLIYFDEVLKTKVLKSLHQALKPEAYLVLGYYDVLPTTANEFFLTDLPEYKIFRKKKES